MEKFKKRFGGYWRYPNLLDFCYLVNPFYPPQKLLDEIKANFERLITQYPSGIEINSLLAAKYYGLDQEYIVVGNGASELIKSFIENLKGNVGLILPTFEEYPNRVAENKKVIFSPKNSDFKYTAEELTEYFSCKDISALIVINPDNPSGNYIKKSGILKLAKWASDKSIKLIVDESFVDFVDAESDASLLTEEIINEYNNLIIIKSISKSFGVPGLRLGVLASSDKELIKFIKKNIAIWNINSFAEFYLQIFEKYKADYELALNNFYAVRENYFNELSSLRNLRVIPSQANYFLCELLNGNRATDLARTMLDRYNILIKELSTKKGFNGEYIRVAVKRPEENSIIVKALTEILS